MKGNKEVNYTEVLNKILICFYIVIAFLALNSILLIVSIGTGDNTTKNTGTTEQEELPYDVSKFDEMTTDEAMKAIQSSEMQVIYIGYSGCGYCRKFVPVLQEAQEAFDYTTIYIDLSKVTTADQEKIVALDTYVSENFGYTPMTILAKDGQYVAGHVGYLDYNSFATFLTANGLTEK